MSNATSQTGSAPTEEAPEAWVGRTIGGRYRVESVLGQGGMGTVYRVIHTGIDRPMALKLLSQRMMNHPNVVARFEREAKAAANFGHEHVAAATDYGRTEDGRFYLVMEYIEGKELRQAMDESEGVLTPSRAFFIARQIASALSRAQKLGIVHRDLKPENIMLVKQDGQDDFVKVLDFGFALISRHLNSSEEGEENSLKTAPKITQVGEIFGTPSYMAPEQTVSQTTDTRTDLYALGIVLYEMLTGLRPFVGKNPVAIIQQQLVTPPPPMKERAPTVNVPADMEALVMHLLAKQPSQRFQTPDELITAIDRIGAEHKFSWPGVTFEADAAPRPRRLADGVATVLYSRPAPQSKLGQALAALQKRLGSGRRSLLFMAFGALMIVLLLGIFFYIPRHVRWVPEGPVPRPGSEAAPPAVSPQASEPQDDEAEPAPANRGGSKHQKQHPRK